MSAPLQASLDKAGEHIRQRMASLRPLCDDIVADLRALARDRVEYPAGRLFVSAGERFPLVYVLDAGWVFRSRSLPDGRRQVLDYALPGDILGSDAVLFGASGFDLVARTPVRVLRLDAPGPADLWRRRPAFAAALAWTAAQEQSILAERVVSLGRRDSLEKLAYALCEMARRLSAVGLLRGDTIESPVNQEDFADMLGISVIHINRTFRRLAAQGAAEYGKTRIRILDLDRLAEIAGFDAGYLHFAD